MAARKRQAPKTPEASGRRRSQRIGSSSKKSKYFEGSDSDSDAEAVSQPKRGRTSLSGRRGAKARPDDSDEFDEPGDDDEYDEDDANADEDEDDDDDGDEGGDGDEDDEEDERSRKGSARKRSGTKGGGGPRKKAKTGANEGSDDDLDEEDDDEVSGKRGPRVTFIPHKKLRDMGGVEYADERLHPNTLLFLRDLKANNKRSWLKSNDGEYRRSLKDWDSFVTALTARVIEADETVPELPVKDVVFRIYRDIRFSKDPTPYKPHYSAAWSRTGRKGPFACYYVHCEPGGRSFVGGGLWHPEADQLAALRASIDERPARWRRALSEERFRKTFLPKAKAGDDKSIKKAFAASNSESALKTKPKGFNADHRDIELLKLRNFTIGKKIPDDLFTADDAQERLDEIISAMVPFITHLNSIVMPDGDDNDDDEEEEEEEEEGEDEEE